MPFCFNALKMIRRSSEKRLGMAIVLPAVFYLRKKEGFVPRGAQAISGAVALAGVFWFIERIVHG